MISEALLRQHFGLSKFRPGQKEVIDSVLAKKDVLAVLPTGAGKSLCYQYIAVATQKLVIVVSPLIALMRDQVAALQKQGIASGSLHSGQSDGEKRQVFQDLNKGGPFLLYLSPERVQKSGFQNWVQTKDIALFAVDEAHCVSQWGHDFREEYGELKILKQLCPNVPILALTASATPTVLSDVAHNLLLKGPDKHIYGFYRPNLYYQVEICNDEEAKALLVTQGLRQNPQGRVLIYCGTRRVTEELAHFLSSNFSQVGFYHAGLSADQRTTTQQAYMKGDIRILVATNAFGMGIDQPDVRLVVHFQMPANIDALYQEMGRAGRDGKESTCLMLYSKKDKGLQSFFIQNSEAPKKIKDLRWRNLDTLVNYSEGSECRHGEILTYYRDRQRIERCGHCDSCNPRSDRRILLPEKPAARSLLRPSKNKKSAKLRPIEQPMTPADDVRFQALRKWRKAKAAELDVPAFVVFSDQTLRQLAVSNPQSLDGLKQIHGIGEAKLEKFGWDLLAELSS